MRRLNQKAVVWRVLTVCTTLLSLGQLALLGVSHWAVQAGAKNVEMPTTLIWILWTTTALIAAASNFVSVQKFFPIAALMWSMYGISAWLGNRGLSSLAIPLSYVFLMSVASLADRKRA